MSDFFANTTVPNPSTPSPTTHTLSQMPGGFSWDGDEIIRALRREWFFDSDGNTIEEGEEEKGKGVLESPKEVLTTKPDFNVDSILGVGGPDYAVRMRCIYKERNMQMQMLYLDDPQTRAKRTVARMKK